MQQSQVNRGSAHEPNVEHAKRESNPIGVGPFATPIAPAAPYSYNSNHADVLRLSTEEMLDAIHQGKEIVLGPSIRGEIPLLALAGVLLIGTVYFAVMQGSSFGPFSDEANGTLSEWIVFLTNILILPVAIAASALHRLFNSKAYLRRDEFLAETGRISWRTRAVKLPYEKIRAVEITSTLYGKLLNIGELRLSTPFFDQPEVVIRRIVDPSRYQPVLESLAALSHKERIADDLRYAVGEDPGESDKVLPYFASVADEEEIGHRIKG